MILGCTGFYRVSNPTILEMEEVLPEIRDESYLVFTSRVSVAIYIEDNKKKSGERVLRPLSAGGGFFLFRIPRPFDIFVFGGAGIFMGFYRRRRRRFLKIRPLGETRMKNGGGASFFVSFLFLFRFLFCSSELFGFFSLFFSLERVTRVLLRRRSSSVMSQPKAHKQKSNDYIVARNRLVVFSTPSNRTKLGKKKTVRLA